MRMTQEQWQALSDKADWEGGWAEYILGYGGVTTTPSVQQDEELTAMIRVFEQAWIALESVIHAYEALYEGYAVS